MPSLFKVSLLPLAVALALGLPFSANSQEKAKLEKPVVSEDASGEEEEEGKGLDIGQLLPLNKPSLHVKIPSFTEGELASMVEAEKLTRIDDTNLRLEQATIQMILPQALVIKLRTGLYNTDGAILSSDERTTISSKEFTMTGTGLDFDTASTKGRMKGPVRMIIHSVQGMTGPEKKPIDKDKKPTNTRTASKEKPTK